LLEAGAMLADDGGLASMTVDAVVNQAGTGKGTFYRHFPDQSSFLAALHERFLAGLRATVTDAASRLAPGSERLQRVLCAYLDGCLGQRGLKAFLTEARVVPNIEARVDLALREFADLLAADLKSMSISHPGAVARLTVAMAYEVAMAEQASGHRERTLRDVLITLATEAPRTATSPQRRSARVRSTNLRGA
jgi:TetR/AcrR family transcriptional repressor of nem operon